MDELTTANPLLEDLRPEPVIKTGSSLLLLFVTIGLVVLVAFLLPFAVVECLSLNTKAASSSRDDRESNRVSSTSSIPSTNDNPKPVPEPGTLALLGAGAAAAFVIWRRSKSKRRGLLQALLVLGTILFTTCGWSADPTMPVPRTLADAVFIVARVCEQKGDHDGAIAASTEAIRLGQKSIHSEHLADSYFMRGNAWLGKKEYDKAIVDYNEAIRLYPKFASAYVDLGWICIKKGEYDKAIAYCNKGLKIQSTYIYGRFVRATAFQKKGEYDKAIADWTEVINDNPMNTVIYGNRGTCYSKIGEKAKAEADFAKARSPGHGQPVP